MKYSFQNNYCALSLNKLNRETIPKKINNKGMTIVFTFNREISAGHIPRWDVFDTIEPSCIVELDIGDDQIKPPILRCIDAVSCIISISVHEPTIDVDIVGIHGTNVPISPVDSVRSKISRAVESCCTFSLNNLGSRWNDQIL